MNLLVVEDDQAAQFALSALLDDLGARVLLAASGGDALRLVLKHEFAAAIRSLERTRRTPIIFMSTGDDRRMRARDGDEDIYLRKPLEPDVIRPTLAQLLARREAP